MTSPAERKSIAKIAANSRWARESDRTAATAAARKNSPASIEYWLKKVDPHEEMPYQERIKRAENAKAAYYARVMRKARQAKAAKAAKASGEAA
ncbi:hypothetical protein AB0395_28785 [Streptosporangium sp. NPDC051023]|uniref:hypothetical protein n=1 Tax=Streptosporangium sp. NPDC051023 TaxID=3155410 RepID=UPI00344B4084